MQTSLRQRGAAVVIGGLLLASIGVLGVTSFATATSCDADAGVNGATKVTGTPKNDACLAGGNGADDLAGKAGNDVIVGGRGPDRLRGGGGNDVLRGGQGPDIFVCGPGKDVVYNHRGTGTDRIDPSCETVR